MTPQNMGCQPVFDPEDEALESHYRRLKRTRYQWQITSCNVPSRNTHVSLTSEPGCARHVAVSRPINSYRRLKCQRALNCWQHSALLRPCRHAQAAKQTKNTLWLHPSLSRLSQLTQVSTSKTTSIPTAGQAFAPVLTPHLLTIPRILTVGGASC